MPESLLLKTLLVMVLLTIVVSFRRNWRCSLVLLLSLVPARLVANGLADVSFHSHAMFICAFICIIGWRNNGLRLLNIEKYEVNYVVSFLYLLRMIAAIGMMFGVYGFTVMSEVSMVLLTIQVLLILGDSIDAYSKRINDSLRRFRIDTHNRIAAVRWVNS